MSMIYQTENFSGVYEFRCGFHASWFMECHLHEFSEFLYCKKGSVDIVINSQKITLPEKHLLYIPPNYIHQFLQTDAELICAVFSNDFIPLYFKTTQNKRIIPSSMDFHDMSDILENFHNMKDKNILYICGLINIICAKIIEKSEFEESVWHDGTLYQTVINYIATHFNENISLKSIAKKFGYNEKYLSHTLYMLTGVHFTKLVGMYRIEHAKNLINNTEKKFSSIATECGFSSINTFNRTFKELTGTTPTEFKHNAINEDFSFFNHLH